MVDAAGRKARRRHRAVIAAAGGLFCAGVFGLGLRISSGAANVTPTSTTFVDRTPAPPVTSAPAGYSLSIYGPLPGVPIIGPPSRPTALMTSLPTSSLPSDSGGARAATPPSAAALALPQAPPPPLVAPALPAPSPVVAQPLPPSPGGKGVPGPKGPDHGGKADHGGKGPDKPPKPPKPPKGPGPGGGKDGSGSSPPTT